MQRLVSQERLTMYIGSLVSLFSGTKIMSKDHSLIVPLHKFSTDINEDILTAQVTFYSDLLTRCLVQLLILFLEEETLMKSLWIISVLKLKQNTDWTQSQRYEPFFV